jgi:DNA-nicking Smr family endonuclease
MGGFSIIIISYLQQLLTWCSSVQVDLHGLHEREAKEKIAEYILPILPALKKLTIITGYGSHYGEAILKGSIKQYFSNQKIKCIESSKNKGILCLSC